MNRRRIVIETPSPGAFVRKVQDIAALARVGMGVLRVRRFISARPLLCTFLGLGTGFLFARAFGSRR